MNFSLKCGSKAFFSSRHIPILLKSLFIFFVVGLTTLNAKEDPSQDKININVEEVTFEEFFKEIQQKTKFIFFYKDGVLPKTEKISVSKKEADLEELLIFVFRGKNLKYEINGRQVIIFHEKNVPQKQEIKKSETQDFEVSGTVTDSKGVPLPNVTIQEKGTNNGVLTDFDGNYSIEVNSSESVLVYTYVGMKSIERNVGTNTTMNIQMEEDAEALEEIVVVGYGTQEKINLTGSVSTIKEDVLEKRTVTQSSQLLQGAASGVTAVQGSGKPGSDQSDIIIRGRGTFSGAGSDPLVLVDGVPSSLNSVAPSDIESISVLKDAASASIYGSRAANGVILITTKEGGEDGFQVNLDSYVGIQRATQLPQYVDSWIYAEMLNEAQNNVGLGDVYTQEEIERFRSGENPDEYPNKAHVEDLFTSGSGLQTRQNVSINGIEGGTQYLFSTGYLKQEGIMEQTDYDRNDFRLNLKSEVTDNLTLDVRLSGNFSTQNEPGILYENRAGGIDAILRAATSANATVPGEKSDGSYGVHMGHPIASAGLDSDSFVKTRNNYFMNNFSLQWDISESLKLTTRVAYDLNYSKRENFGAIFSWDDQTVEPGPSKLEVGTTDVKNLTMESYLDYENIFSEDHYFHFLGGVSHIRNSYETLGAFRENSPSTQLHVLDAFAEENDRNYGTASTTKLNSVFGRVNYRFKERYLLEANLRYDGSSRFAENDRFGLFPAFSAAWIISKEEFFKVSWIGDFKLRSSYGSMGNQEIGTYPYQRTLNLNQPYPFGEEERLLPGIALTTLPFQNITWETITTFDQGLDMTLFNNRINLSVDYYNRRTSNILHSLTVSSVLGMGVSEQNAGEVENTGWDFELGYRGVMNDFSFSVQSNFSLNNNQVISLGGVERDIGRGLFVGESIGAIYGYKTDGLFVDQSDIENYAVQNYEARPGLIRYRDISGPDGEPDGIVSAEYDRAIIGNTNPKYTFGLAVSADYKGFDFYLLFQGLAGMERLLNGTRLALFNNGNIEQWQVENRWTEENPDRNAAYPRLTSLSSDPEIPFGPASEYWLKDASYLRMKTIQLGYTIPRNITEQTFIDQFRIYISGENLLTISDYPPGWDPEMATGGYRGSSYYPPTSLLMAGININF